MKFYIPGMISALLLTGGCLNGALPQPTGQPIEFGQVLAYDDAHVDRGVTILNASSLNVTLLLVAGRFTDHLDKYIDVSVSTSPGLIEARLGVHSTDVAVKNATNPRAIVNFSIAPGDYVIRLGVETIEGPPTSPPHVVSSWTSEVKVTILEQSGTP